MSLTWALSPYTNDIFINSLGKIQTVYGAEEVRQRILVTLQHYYEEYFLNVPAGVPWYELILGSKDINQVEALIRYAVLNVPNVVSIISLGLSVHQRTFSINMSVEVNGLSSPEIIDVITQLGV